MYINNDGYTYYHGTDQYHSKAPFLILMQDKDQPLGPDNFRAIVRKVALSQWGHWMIGTARIKNQSISISGSYGSDGLPISVDKDVFDMGVEVPKELYELWANGNGWNSCGSEAEEMAAWALKTFEI